MTYQATELDVVNERLARCDAAAQQAHAENEKLRDEVTRLRAHSEDQATLISNLIERLSEAGLVDDMDRVEFNKWSHEHQQLAVEQIAGK